MHECVDFHMCSLVLEVGVCSDFSQRHEAETAHATLRERETEKRKKKEEQACVKLPAKIHARLPL